MIDCRFVLAPLNTLPRNHNAAPMAIHRHAVANHAPPEALINVAGHLSHHPPFVSTRVAVVMPDSFPRLRETLDLCGASQAT